MSRHDSWFFDWTMKGEALGSASMICDAVADSEPPEQDRENCGLASFETNVACARERILDVAERLIRHIGHRKTTVIDIAHDLGTSRANVYRFFPTRAAIDLGVCARIGNRTLKTAWAISQLGDTAGTRLASMFDALHRLALRRLTDEPRIHELLVATLGKREVATWYFDAITRMLEAIIREGSEVGELNVDHAGRAARCAMAAMVSFVDPSLVEQRIVGGDDVGTELEAQARFITRALGDFSDPNIRSSATCVGVRSSPQAAC